MRIRREETIAVAVDYQEKLMPVMFEKDRLIDNSSILLAGLGILEVPIIMTQQYTRGLGNTVPEITDAAGTKEFTEKIKFSAYEDIKDQLKDYKYVIVCGIEAHICVLQTIIDLKAGGYIPVLAADCVSSRKEYDRKTAVSRARDEGALITTYESLLFELLEEAGTRVSKQIQRVIR